MVCSADELPFQRSKEQIMAHLLHIDSSAFADGSVSRKIASTFRTAWQDAGGTVTHRDLGHEPVPPLHGELIAAGVAPVEERTTAQAELFEPRRRLIQEVLDADAYLFAVPMYNWGVPATFKAWLDQIIMVGQTLVQSGESPLAGRPATAILSYGGGYDPGTPREGWDFVEPYLRRVLGEAIHLDLTVIKAQLTLAETTPAMSELIPMAREQQSAAHAAAETHARTVAAKLAA
jgi:FMN-dependent NADH-azoreductase